MGGGGDNLALWQFAGEGLVERFRGVGSAGDAHGLIDIGAAGKRVTDTAAETGGGATEGLNLSRVVVCLVFEVDEPLLLVAVDNDGHHDGAGVDLVAWLLVVKDAGLLETFGGEGSDIHQADELVIAASVLLLVIGQILFESTFKQWPVVSFVKLHILQLGGEGGVAAVVAPVGIEHTNLCHCWVALLIVVEVALYMLEVGKSHCQAETVVEFFEFRLGHILEAVENYDIGRLVKVVFESCWLGLVSHTAVNRVHAVFHYSLTLLVVEFAADDVCSGTLDNRLFSVVE